MVRLGMTYSNWMINVSMTNHKLRERGNHILQEILGVKPNDAEKLVEASGANLKVAVIMGATGCDRREAETDENARAADVPRIGHDEAAGLVKAAKLGYAASRSHRPSTGSTTTAVP